MKFDLKKTCRNVMRSYDSHKPEVLTGVGVGLMLLAIPLSVVATIKANKKIEEKKNEIAQKIQAESEDLDTPVDKDSIEIPTKEIVKSTWMYYIPSVVAAGVGAFCNVSSTKEGLKRTATMAAAYQLSESAFNELRQATKEVVGEKKENDIEKQLIKERMDKVRDPNGQIQNVYDTRDGNQLCFDYWSGRYFYSDVEYIKSRINLLNENMVRESQAFDDAFITVNDLYRTIGLPEGGGFEDQVWRIRHEGLLELATSRYMSVDDQPCWVMAFTKPPRTIPSWMMDKM